MLGVLESVQHATSSGFLNDGDHIFLLGDTKGHIGGSEYLSIIHKKILGDAPEIDLRKEQVLQEFLLSAIRNGLIGSAHDVAEGGLAVALAECCIAGNRKPIGASVRIDSEMRHDRLYFGEDQSRVIISVDASNIPKLKEIHKKCSEITLQEIGRVGGDALKINNDISLDIETIHRVYYTSIQNHMESSVQ
jgi:phosphoribosylformylglycinamidine synthase subunit PurL